MTAENPQSAGRRVIFCFNTGRIRRLHDDTPDDFFYGFRHYARINPGALLVEPHPETQGVVDHTGAVYPLPPILRRLSRALKGTRLSGLIRVLQALFACRALFAGADAIVAVTNTWIYAFSLLRRLGLLRCPVVGVAIGPFNPATGLRGRIRNRLKRYLFAGTHLAFLGDADEESFRAHIDPKPASTEIAYFGIDETFWTPDKASSSTTAGRHSVFSIGSAGRDYGTLIKAWDRDDAQLKIVTSLLEPGGSYPPGVEVVHGIWHDSALTDDDVRDLYRGASIVVCPLKDTTQPCGQSATLQAMACGKSVVLTRTTGLWDINNMRHGENCVLVEPGDVAALREAIDYLIRSPQDAQRLGRNARETVIDLYSANRFANQLHGMINRVAGAGAS